MFGQLGMGPSVMLPAIQAEFLQQFVCSGVIKPTDLGKQNADGFRLWSLGHSVLHLFGHLILKTMTISQR